jgi:hypothetical protein
MALPPAAQKKWIEMLLLLQLYVVKLGSINANCKSGVLLLLLLLLHWAAF